MRKFLLLSAAALAASAGSAFAQDHTGISVAIGATQFDGDFEFTGGKPTQELSGTLPTLRLGADYQFGGDEGGPVLGASYFTTFGDGIQSPPNRDGNYLVQDGRIDGLSGWEVRAGWAFGDWLPYVAYGQTERDGVTRQSCPNDPASVVAGFCAGGFVPATATARAGQREGSVDGSGETISLGLEWNLSEHVFFDARASQTDFGEQIVSLDPTGNTPGQLAHPLTNPSQDSQAFSFAIGWRF